MQRAEVDSAHGRLCGRLVAVVRRALARTRRQNPAAAEEAAGLNARNVSGMKRGPFCPVLPGRLSRATTLGKPA